MENISVCSKKPVERKPYDHDISLMSLFGLQAVSNHENKLKIYLHFLAFLQAAPAQDLTFLKIFKKVDKSLFYSKQTLNKKSNKSSNILFTS